MELEQYQKILQEMAEKSESAVGKTQKWVEGIINYRKNMLQQQAESSFAGASVNQTDAGFFKKDTTHNSDSNLELIGQGCKKAKEELENINALTKDNVLETAATFGFGASQSSSHERAS